MNYLRSYDISSYLSHGETQMELQAIIAAIRGVVQLFDTIERLGSFKRTEPTQEYLDARDEVRRQLVILSGTLGND